MRADILVSVREQTDVASVRRIALQAASTAGFDPQAAGELALIVTEAATNQVKHAGGGDIILRDLSAGGKPFMEVIALDTGRGMSNLARCFSDGFSTAGSPGNGLGAIARLADFYDIFSEDGKGTVLVAQVGSPSSEAHFEIGAVSIPYPGETVCGDAWDFNLSERRIRLIMADGLGHGVFAAEASSAAVSLIDDESQDPADLIERAHLRLKSTRGAAIGVMDIDDAGRAVTFAGVGNIAAGVVTEDGMRRQMTSMNGTLGHEVRAVRQFQYPWPGEALIVMHSDGLGTHWSLARYNGLMKRHPSVIAGVLFRDFRRLRDDATVVVLRGRS